MTILHPTKLLALTALLGSAVVAAAHAEEQLQHQQRRHRRVLQAQSEWPWDMPELPDKNPPPVQLNDAEEPEDPPPAEEPDVDPNSLEFPAADTAPTTLAPVASPTEAPGGDDDDDDDAPTTAPPESVPTPRPAPTTRPAPTAATWDPTLAPVAPSTEAPSASGMPTTVEPTWTPTGPTTGMPTTGMPSDMPSDVPTTEMPSEEPTEEPTWTPTGMPSDMPSDVPTEVPTEAPTTGMPSDMPTGMPTTEMPSNMPSNMPSDMPTGMPTTEMPSDMPSDMPTDMPSDMPSGAPTETQVCVEGTIWDCLDAKMDVGKCYPYKSLKHLVFYRLCCPKDVFVAANGDDCDVAIRYPGNRRLGAGEGTGEPAEDPAPSGGSATLVGRSPWALAAGLAALAGVWN